MSFRLFVIAFWRENVNILPHIGNNRIFFFNPIPTSIMDSFSFSPLNTTFYLFKKRLPETSYYAEMQHNTMTSSCYVASQHNQEFLEAFLND